jgi:exoribonuclease R
MIAVNNWISGTLELSSKVRYGITSRGVPIFRFIPYDRRFPPMAVGCAARELFYNVHAIVEPNPSPSPPGQLHKATLVQNLGQPTVESETQVLLACYAFDSQKELRREPQVIPPFTLDPADVEKRQKITDGFTFHIDPPGCKDVDDSFTFERLKIGAWRVHIHIADVSAWLSETSIHEKILEHAHSRATSFYSPDGKALAPMFPRQLSEGSASLSPGSEKPAVTLSFSWDPSQNGGTPWAFEWNLTMTRSERSFTYEEAYLEREDYLELKALADLAARLGGDENDSHTWVQALMILYNTHAGLLLAELGSGILRRHSEPKKEQLEALRPLFEKEPALKFLAYESAEYCLPTEAHTSHHGLEVAAYAYASSPLRRYADYVNQLVLKGIINGTYTLPCSKELVDHLNRREKQAKAFSRDLFFLTNMRNTPVANVLVQGVVLSVEQKQKEKKFQIRVWVSAWKRKITVRSLSEFIKAIPLVGSTVQISWYENPQMPNWKEKIVFKLLDGEPLE